MEEFLCQLVHILMSASVQSNILAKIVKVCLLNSIMTSQNSFFNLLYCKGDVNEKSSTFNSLCVQAVMTKFSPIHYALAVVQNSASGICLLQQSAITLTAAKNHTH